MGARFQVGKKSRSVTYLHLGKIQPRGRGANLKFGSVFLSVCLSVCLCACLSVCLCVCVPVCLRVSSRGGGRGVLVAPLHLRLPQRQPLGDLDVVALQEHRQGLEVHVVGALAVVDLVLPADCIDQEGEGRGGGTAAPHGESIPTPTMPPMSQSPPSQPHHHHHH